MRKFTLTVIASAVFTLQAADTNFEMPPLVTIQVKVQGRGVSLEEFEKEAAKKVSAFDPNFHRPTSRVRIFFKPGDSLPYSFLYSTFSGDKMWSISANALGELGVAEFPRSRPDAVNFAPATGTGTTIRDQP